MKKKVMVVLSFFLVIGAVLIYQLPVSKLQAKEMENIKVDDLYFLPQGDQELPLELKVGETFSLTLVSENEGYDEIQIPIPEALSYDAEETLKNNSEIFENQEELETVITQKENVLSISLKEHQLQSISLSFTATKAMQQANIIAVSTIEGVAVESPDVSLQVKGKKEVSAQAGGSLIAPAAGTINTDLDISPVQSSILSGQEGSYALSLKVTGAVISYKNAHIEVQLPTNGEFTQELNELKIAGVTPTYDNDTHKLSYYFETLQSGQANQVIIKVGTKNGVTVTGTKMTATANFTADNFFANASTTATINVTASSTLSASKSYVSTLNASGAVKTGPPVSGDQGKWKISVNAAKNTTGILYFKEGSKIKIVDTIPTSMTYVSNDTGGVYDSSKRTVTWEFDAPTILNQEAATDSLFSKDLQVTVKFASNLSNLQKLTNTAQVTATDIAGNVLTKNVSATVNAGTDGVNIPGSSGSFWPSTHASPSNGTGGEPSVNNADINPAVYDTGILSYRFMATPWTTNSYSKDFEKYEITYFIDDHLKLESIDLDNAEYSPDPAYQQAGGENYRLTGTNAPKIDVYATINGTETLLIKDIKQANYWNLISELNVNQSAHISKLRFVYTYRPAGTYQKFHVKFSIQKGYVGQVENKMYLDVTGYNAAGNKVSWNNTPEMNTVNTNSGPRHANVVAKPTGMNPILKSSVEFNSQDNGIVKIGSNRIFGDLVVDASSQVALSAPFESMVLLPEGVTVDEQNPQYQVGSMFANAFDTATSDGNNKYGTIKIETNNYSNTGRQLVRIKWNQTQALYTNSRIRYQFNVVIAENAPTKLIPEIYNFVNGQNFSVPTVSGEGVITDSYRIQDTEDMNGDGNKGEYYVKSANQYYLLRQDKVTTEKQVKGALDQDYSQFGHTTLGGAIDYRLLLTNDGETKISNMVLMDVLPSIGDLGITDNAARESKFTPVMTGPVTLPVEWQDKVDIHYSTSKNPSRADLIKNVVYTSTTIQIKDPTGAEAPKWLSAAEVTDWQAIHSFKLELKQNADWVSGDKITIDFSMKAPVTMSNELVDASVDETTRAAWNSFAFASNNLQAVEPSRVGIVVNEAYNLQVEKVDAQEQTNVLGGAEFTLFNAAKEQIGQETSDKDGKLHFYNLAPGTYFIQETKAPQSYGLNPTIYQIDIDSTGKVTMKNQNEAVVSVKDADEEAVIQLVLSNKKNLIPVTGSTELVISILTGISLIAGSSIYFYLKRRQGSFI